MKIHPKQITLMLTILIIFAGPYFKRNLRNQIKITDGKYQLYSDDNNECGEVSVSNSKDGNKKLLICEYRMEGISKQLIFDHKKNKYGNYYCARQGELVYVIVKSLDGYLCWYDVENEKTQNKFHLFCVSGKLFDEILIRMEKDPILFFQNFTPRDEYFLSLHFGKKCL